MPEKELYALRVRPAGGPMDPQLAAAVDDVNKASARDPDRRHNNPGKKRRALEGLGTVIADWEAENGAITEEEMVRARTFVEGDDIPPRASDTSPV